MGVLDEIVELFDLPNYDLDSEHRAGIAVFGLYRRAGKGDEGGVRQCIVQMLRIIERLASRLLSECYHNVLSGKHWDFIVQSWGSGPWGEKFTKSQAWEISLNGDYVLLRLDARSYKVQECPSRGWRQGLCFR